MLHLLYSILVLYASAEEMYAYPVQKIPLRGISEIKVIGVNGHLNVRGRGKQTSLNLKVSHPKSRKYEDWQLQVERRGTTLFLEVFNVAYGKAWDKQVKQAVFPEFDIDLDGSALPIIVAWREGRLHFTDWNNSIDASFLKGFARVDGGGGLLKLQPVEGDITVDHHVGELFLSGQSGAVTLTRGTGALNVNWLSGKLRIEKWKGAVELQSQNSDLIMREISGAVSARIERGHADIRAGAGRVKAQGSSCAWEISAEAPANLNLSTGAGSVLLSWKGGGQVFLTSKHGDVEILHSDFLATISKDGGRVAEGRKLMSKMGQVFVKSESGRIRWRQ